MKTTREISADISGKIFEFIKWSFPFIYMLWYIDVMPIPAQIFLIGTLYLFEFYYWFLLIFVSILVSIFFYTYFVHHERFKKNITNVTWSPLPIEQRISTILYFAFIIYLVYVGDWSLVVCLTLMHVIAICMHMVIPYFHMLYGKPSEPEVDIGERSEI